LFDRDVTYGPKQADIPFFVAGSFSFNRVFFLKPPLNFIISAGISTGGLIALNIGLLTDEIKQKQTNERFWNNFQGALLYAPVRVIQSFVDENL